MPYNSETETFYQAPATVVDSTPDGDTVQEGFDDRLTPALAGLYADLNLLKADGMISVGIPATTTARGIGRVATAADAAPGSTITNGPAFLDAATWKVSATPTAHTVPQADAEGKLDGWVSLSTKANTSLDNITSAAENVIRDATKVNLLGTRDSLGAWTLTGVTPMLPLIVTFTGPAESNAVLVPTQGIAGVGNTIGFTVGPFDYGPVAITVIPNASTVILTVVSGYSHGAGVLYAYQ